ncbi:MAG: hypothetical protein NTU44_14255, partial [Bacteroidetes bacterium]|nr:hypothetical protein [Bacteroidota bacterium]
QHKKWVEPDEYLHHYKGERNYELTNHLGNVMVILSDHKKGIDMNTNMIVDYYEPILKSTQDYYPGGMLMPGRSYSSDKYRFGFNGKENDNEVKGTGNSQDYGMRIYDPRIIRFNSVDPLTKKFPFYSPYHFAGNSFISAVDLDGKEPNWVVNQNGYLTAPVIAIIYVTTDVPINGLINTNITRNASSNNVAETWGSNDVRTNPSGWADNEQFLWIGTMGHEFTHRQDFEDFPGPDALFRIKNQTEIGFREKVLGMPHNIAYKGSSEEMKAFKNEARINLFVSKYHPEKVLSDDNFDDKQKLGLILPMLSDYMKYRSENICDGDKDPDKPEVLGNLIDGPIISANKSGN